MWLQQHGLAENIEIEIDLCLFDLQAPMYYRRANAAIIVYDITSEKTFDEAMQWIKGTVHVLYMHC